MATPAIPRWPVSARGGSPLPWIVSCMAAGRQAREARRSALLRTRAHDLRTRFERAVDGVGTINGSNGKFRRTKITIGAGHAPERPRFTWDGPAIGRSTASLELVDLSRTVLSEAPEKQTYRTRPPWKFDILSSVMLTAIHSLGKLWLNLPFLGPRTLTVLNQPAFERLVKDRSPDQPMITVCNHTATMDDPIIWCTLPTRFAMFPHRLSRWTLGAREIVFFNPWISWVFRKLQTIPISRGEGIYQQGMTEGLDRLSRGGWVHIFSEGRVQQEPKMPRFKWGVGRLLLDAEKAGCRTPLFVPVYTRGLEKVLPLGKVNILRPGYDILLAFGDPVDFGPIVKQVRARYPDESVARSRITTIVSDLMHALQMSSIETWRERLGREPTSEIPHYWLKEGDHFKDHGERTTRADGRAA